MNEFAGRLKSGFSNGSEASRLKENYITVTWEKMLSKGLKQSAKISPNQHTHMALNFQNLTESIGQCVISLSSAYRRQGRKVDFQAPLTVGGRLTGEISGKIKLKVW